MADDANQAYFKAHGWPMHMSGTLKTLVELDKGELLVLAGKYASVLQTEYGQITVPSKRIPEPVEKIKTVEKPRARKKPKRKSRATHR